MSPCSYIVLRNSKENRTANKAAAVKDVFLKVRWKNEHFLGSKHSESDEWVILVYLCGKHLVHFKSFHNKALSPHIKVLFSSRLLLFSPVNRNAICFTCNPSIFLNMIITDPNSRPFYMINTPF